MLTYIAGDVWYYFNFQRSKTELKVDLLNLFSLTGIVTHSQPLTFTHIITLTTTCIITHSQPLSFTCIPHTHNHSLTDTHTLAQSHTNSPLLTQSLTHSLILPYICSFLATESVRILKVTAG